MTDASSAASKGMISHLKEYLTFVYRCLLETLEGDWRWWLWMTVLAAVSLLRQLAENATVPIGESMLAASYQKPITIEFRDASLKQIFEVISRTSGLNFLFDKEVKSDQTTSIFLKNSTVESAIYLILLTIHLEQRVLDSNTILSFRTHRASCWSIRRW